MRPLLYIIPLFFIFSVSSATCNALFSEYLGISRSESVLPPEPNDAPNIPRPAPLENSTTEGCPEANYPDWETSPYVLPYPVAETYEVRLSNCSSSFHAEGTNDELAFDFVMDVGTLITASRAGTVVYIEEDGHGRELNNLVVVDHGDGTFGEYMHLQFEGALVNVGDVVEQGDAIGLSGATGLAGYPHLHFIVVRDTWEWPYIGVPVTFSNTAPNPRSLLSDTPYTALPYPN